MTRVTPELAGAPFTVANPDLVPATPAVVLENPRDPRDVAEVIYAASCYGIGQVWLSGDRVRLDPAGPPARQREARGWEPVTVVQDWTPPDLRLTRGTVVAVERGKPDAVSMAWFQHPSDAVYVFGPEDGDLSAGTLARADVVVEIPARHSLYLAGAVWVCLYDRAATWGLPESRPLTEMRGN
jgi:tRNA(Leu) C34 or U34 (ribose-2'-O)-methylase TrmL